MRDAVTRSSGYQWVIKKEGIKIKGNKTSGPRKPLTGFRKTGVADGSFFVCYEFVDGIAVHTNGDPDARAFCVDLTMELGAKMFEL
jgi:hypothetical protein